MPERTVSILIVDDDLVVKNEIKPLIESWGASVTVTASGYGALDRLCLEHYDIVILSTDLPLFKSSDTLKHIKKIDAAMPVIAFVADETSTEAKKVLQAGVNGFVKKPVDKERLKIAVDEVMNGIGLSLTHPGLKEKGGETYNFQNIVGSCEKIRDIFKLIRKVKDSNITVLIQGESGTGKELVARAIHFNSSRKARPFVSVSCAAIPETLLESELFGFEKGAFTGAVRQGIGRFEQANGGTLFLDEIGEMSSALQAKFLRVIETGEFERIGGRVRIKTDVRIISATNQNLKKKIADKSFRDDLYYRISAFPIYIPPLRERKEDIPILIDHFLSIFRINDNSKVRNVSKEALEILVKYAWPGNVRELENLLERITVVTDKDTILPEDLPAELFLAGRGACVQPGADANPAACGVFAVKKLDDMESAAIKEAVHAAGGNVSLTAKRLGIGRATLYRKAKKYGIQL